jgi:transposase
LSACLTPQQESGLESHHDNTIEQFFAKLKAFLRKVAARTIPELWDAVPLAIDRFGPKECENFFAHAGYDA